MSVFNFPLLRDAHQIELVVNHRHIHHGDAQAFGYGFVQANFICARKLNRDCAANAVRAFFFVWHVKVSEPHFLRQTFGNHAARRPRVNDRRYQS